MKAKRLGGIFVGSLWYWILTIFFNYSLVSLPQLTCSINVIVLWGWGSSVSIYNGFILFWVFFAVLIWCYIYFAPLIIFSASFNFYPMIFLSVVTQLLYYVPFPPPINILHYIFIALSWPMYFLLPKSYALFIFLYFYFARRDTRGLLSPFQILCSIFKF